MLILEGADCIGKTTLAQQLEECIKAEVRRNGFEMPDLKKRHLGPEGASMTSDDYISQMHLWTIQDRFHLSEVAYGITFRGHSNVGPYEVECITKALRDRKGILVVMHAGAGVYGHLLETYHHTRAEKYDDLIALVQVNDSFKEMANLLSEKYMHVVSLEVKMQNGIIRRPSKHIVHALAYAYVRLQMQITPMQTVLPL